MGPCQSPRKGKSLRGVSVCLGSESELEIANNNRPLTSKRSYTSLVRTLDQNGNDGLEEGLGCVFGVDANGNSFKKPRIEAGGEDKSEDRCEDDDRGSQDSEEVETFFDAVEDFNDYDTGESENEDVNLSDCPHINNFPELEDIDVTEDIEEETSQDQGQSHEDLHNTSITAPDPEFSDHQWSQSQRTSELDLIVYSDRTSSEFFPDPRACVRNEPMPTIWDIET